MSKRHAETRPPLIPQPLSTRDALRQAVNQVVLARLPVFDRDLGEASEHAIQLSSITPMRLFLEKWATLVAIERHPEQARMMREAERTIADPSAPEDAFRKAQAAVTRILDTAAEEAGVALW
ncbi:hypothetical protein [Streptomyces sp. NBC_01451]|uniref:hypothetical protein n=1 Tax=Streptomyces sp. NBC_01451 TaxID=2903872 RepID=UPI002E2EE63D|nr:hypothetical protein [Streptomyces sp. NBC_01451]